MLSGTGFVGLEALRTEIEAASLGPYTPPRGSQALVPHSPDGDWASEVLRNSSGIQRKSKGRGQLSQCIFHQCSEFAALYVGRPKASVHLLLAPRRPMQRCDLS